LNRDRSPIDLLCHKSQTTWLTHAVCRFTEPAMHWQPAYLYRSGGYLHENRVAAKGANVTSGRMRMDL